MKMKMFKINCPFCEGNSVSDVIDKIEDVDGQWECNNGHQFTIKYLRKMEYISSLNDPKAFEGINLGILKRRT